ncbi:MAG: hypothetical protein Q4G03_04585 [Planctomycetia bacterium]|nr:hypothetical protein [Planctomycetia bacterium]
MKKTSFKHVALWCALFGVCYAGIATDAFTWGQSPSVYSAQGSRAQSAGSGVSLPSVSQNPSPAYSGAVVYATTESPYASHSDVFLSDVEITAVQATNDEDAGAVSSDPLENLQRQLEELQKTTESLQKSFDDEKAKNAKKNTPGSAFNTKIAGQARADAVFVSQDDVSRENLGDAENTIGYRDIRLVASGSGHGVFEYACGFKYTGNVTLLDVWLRVKDTKYFGDLAFGHYFVELGMESVEANYDRVFAMLDENSTSFCPGRRLGISATYFDQDRQSRAFFGAFAANSLSTSPHRINNDDPGLILNTRLTSAPILVEDDNGFVQEVLHFGGSYMWVSPTDTNSWNFNSQGLGWSGTNPYFLTGKVPLDGRSYSVANLETAWQRGGFAATAEGYFSSVSDGGGNAYGTSIATRWMLTPGCTRSYVKQTARFGTVKMSDDALFVDYRNRIIGQNFGAWEAVAKWQWTEAEDLKNFDGTAGQVNRLTTGFNWFWNEQTFWTFNWEHAFVNSAKSGKAKEKMDFDTLVVQGSIRF